jgi:hypothetical protein
VPLYEITETGLVAHDKADFVALGLYERADLQRLLRDDISVVDADLLVIAEEFGQWEDARRRIDLLAIDRDAHLTVIELKRTAEGGHMELQALRYAAMVSSMRFEEVAATYAAHVAKHRLEEEVDARAELLAWLDAGDGEDEAPISSDVRIVLVSADFGREITTTVLWLNRFEGMDIRCVRLVPYKIDGRVLLDIQQVVPLPEAGDYQVRLRRKDKQQERVTRDGRDFTRYHVIVDGQVLPDENKRHAVRTMVQQLIGRGVAASSIGEILSRGRFRFVEGELTEEDAVVAALRADSPRIDARRWFVEYPIPEQGRTWLLRRQWGRNTEPTLTALSQAFPDAKVSFRRAEEA